MTTRILDFTGVANDSPRLPADSVQGSFFTSLDANAEVFSQELYGSVATWRCDDVLPNAFTVDMFLPQVNFNSRGPVFLNSSGNGIGFLIRDSDIRVFEYAGNFLTGGALATYSVSVVANDIITVEANQSAGTYLIKQNGTLVGTYNQSGLSGLFAGFTLRGGTFRTWILTYAGGSSPTIDSYPAEVRSGQTGIAYTTSNLASVTSVSVGTLAAVSLSDTTGDGTHALPGLTDGAAHEMFGTKTVTFNGSGPTTTTNFLPPTGHVFATLGNDIDSSTNGIVHGFSPAAAENDQIVTPNGLTPNARGQASGEAGTYNCWHIQASTKIARSYSVTFAPPGDTTPDSFTFTDQTNVARSTLIESNVITVSGIDTPAAISVTGGEYAVNTGSGFGAFTSSATTVANGNTVKVRHTSSASFSTAVNTTLTIGSVSDTFTSTTLAADTTPNSFSFTDVSNANLSTQYTSNSITVGGINTTAAISITGGTYSINGGAYTGTAGNVSNGDSVAVRVTSSGSYSTAVNATLTIGGVSDTYTVTTGAEPTTPPTMPADTSVNVAENTTAVGTFAASTGTGPITYSLGGADAALFSINSSTAVVAFLSAPNFESGNNTRNITVIATNAYGSDSQNITVNVTNVVEAPVMPADRSYTVIAGQTVVGNSGASFVDGVTTYTKSGTNQALFNINSSTGALTFISPATVGTYTVIVTATNAAGSDAQILTVNVIDAPVLSGKRSLSIGLGIGLGL